MFQRADEDPLLEFANEPEAVPPLAAPESGSAQTAANVDVARPVDQIQPASASIAAFATRLEKLEHAHDRTIGQLSLLRADVATLVAALQDIKKNDLHRSAKAPLPRTSIATVPRWRGALAVIGVLVGLAIGMAGWMAWQGEPIAAIDAVPAPVAAAAPIEDAAPAPVQPAIALASTNSVQRQTREAPETIYMGTLSIDAAPGGDVFVNRKKAGRTPLRVTNLKAGSHLVWIERDGYRRFTRVVQVPANRVSRLWADLEPLTP